MITFNVITIFPEAFESYIKTSILGRAQKNKLIRVNLVNLRDFAADKSRSFNNRKSSTAWAGYKTVDDKAFGGGPGMVLKVEPIYKAVSSIMHQVSRGKRRTKTRTILFSTRGKKFDQKTARRLSKYDNLILICGRYEGVDERVAKYIADEEISIGDYILSGGELPAMILIEAVSRHVPGVLGKHESLEEVKGSYPVYTRPAVFIVTKDKRQEMWKVPKILLSGNHKKIDEWRKKRK